MRSFVRQNGVALPHRLLEPQGLAPSSGVPVGAWPEGLCAILLKRLLPTRLETRTKESTRHASVLAEKPTRVMKVK